MENSKKINFIILFVYLFITIFALFHHEIWRDEAQAWCLVRDLNFFEIVNNIKIEGHPCIWYLILFPLTRLHLPVESMQILSLLFVFVSVIFFIFKSPFNYFQKILIVFSAGMLYYLPIIARSYSLIPILIFICAYFYPKRFDKPYMYLLPILLLSHVHLYMLGFCIVCYCIYIYEIKNKLTLKNLIPVSLLFINFVFIGCLFLYSMSRNYAFTDEVRNFLGIFGAIKLVSKAFFYKIFVYINFLRKYDNVLSVLIFYPGVGLILYSLFKSDKKIFLICFFSIIYIFLVYGYIFFNGVLYQKIFLIMLILIFGMWNTKHNVAGKTGFYILFLISLIISPLVVFEEIKFNFAGSKEIAQYIRKNLNGENTFIAVGNPYLYSSLSAYLPDKKFYNVMSQSYISFYTYQKSEMDKSEEYPENAKYSIVQEDIKIPKDSGIEKLFDSDKANLSSNTQREVFSIYYAKE